MTDSSDANKERNRQIARNEEARQITGSIRVSTWAIAVAVVIGAVVSALIWIAARQ
jgi:hypothetical protein